MRVFEARTETNKFIVTVNDTSLRELNSLLQDSENKIYLDDEMIDILCSEALRFNPEAIPSDFDVNYSLTEKLKLVFEVLR